MAAKPPPYEGAYLLMEIQIGAAVVGADKRYAGGDLASTTLTFATRATELAATEPSEARVAHIGEVIRASGELIVQALTAVGFSFSGSYADPDLLAEGKGDHAVPRSVIRAPKGPLS